MLIVASENNQKAKKTFLVDHNDTLNFHELKIEGDRVIFQDDNKDNQKHVHSYLDALSITR